MVGKMSDAEFLYKKLKEIIKKEYEDEIEDLKNQLREKEDDFDKELDKYKSSIQTDVIKNLEELLYVEPYGTINADHTRWWWRSKTWLPSSGLFFSGRLYIKDDEAIKRTIEVLKSRKFEG